MSVLRGGSPLNGRQGFGHCRAALRRSRSGRPGSCLLSRPRIPSLGSAGAPIGAMTCWISHQEEPFGQEPVEGRQISEESSSHGVCLAWRRSRGRGEWKVRGSASALFRVSPPPFAFLLSLSTTCIQLGLIHLNSSNGVPVEVHRLPVEMAAQHRPGSADCGRVAPPRNRRPVCRL
jgi:hypothetical protein